LSEVQPMMDMAKNAVQGIKKNNLTELRSFITPPQPILDVMKAVMSMFGIYEYTWSAMK
jgi:hypothetical protein